MYVIKGNNVNDIYFQTMSLLRDPEEAADAGLNFHERESRYGPVLEFDRPMASVYEFPWECVLFDPGRDANPYFHCMEALWVLAGRSDLAFVERYLAKYREFSDDGITIHDAYGFRWREHFGPGLDQLETCIEALKANHDDRRAVLTMWDPKADLGRAGKAFPCNTHVYLKVRHGVLIATVCCRSNDMIWGAYGANAVQFGFLMAYVAARVGVGIGTLTQVSDSAHVYRAVFDKMPTPSYDRGQRLIGAYPGTSPLCTNPDTFLDEVRRFCVGGHADLWDNDFLTLTAHPMRLSWDAWKDKNLPRALQLAQEIAAPDWQRACVAWLARRQEVRA